VTLSYDRRVPPELLAVLLPGGWAHSLVEYGGAGQFALDLQLRGYAGKHGHWATLYVGLTKVLDLHYRPPERFRLSAHKTWASPKYGWNSAWTRSQPPDRLAAQWPAVEEYLERVIPEVGSRFMKKEGAVQSAISAFATRHFVVIDREAAVAFGSQEEKDEVAGELTTKLLGALARPNDAAWWKSKPKSLGGECDALAVTPRGDLLTIEVKPKAATTTIRWAPIQARHYADLFARWVREDDKAPAVLRGMVDQRVQLGLADAAHRPRIDRPIRVRPVIAIGRGWSGPALDGLREVQQCLVDAGLNDPSLEVGSVNLAGRFDPIPV
jgi:hypothetical protein